MTLIILGAGGFGRVIADIASQSNEYSEIAFLDDNSAESDVLGKCADYGKYIAADCRFYAAFGNNQLRMEWLDKLEQSGAQVATIIHCTAYISPTARVGLGTAVLPHAVVNSHTEIGKGCLLNIGILVDHNCTISDGAHLCLGAIVKANNVVPTGYKVEAGVVVERGAME